MAETTHTAKTVMIVDYESRRQSFMMKMVESAIGTNQIKEIKGEKATKQEPGKPIDFTRADELAMKQYDLVLYNTLSNPPPKNFIEKFKKNNNQSRVILYTDLPTFSVGDFNQYRLADGMVTVKDGDEADSSRINAIQDAIRTYSQESPTAKRDWLTAHTVTITQFSKAAAAWFGLAGIVIGFIVGDFAELTKWWTGSP